MSSPSTDMCLCVSLSGFFSPDVSAERCFRADVDSPRVAGKKELPWKIWQMLFVSLKKKQDFRSVKVAQFKGVDITSLGSLSYSRPIASRHSFVVLNHEILVENSYLYFACHAESES